MGICTNMLIIGLCDQSLKTTILGQWFSIGTMCPHPVTFGHAWRHFWMLTLGEGVLASSGCQEAAEHPTMHRTALPHPKQISIWLRLESNKMDKIFEGSVSSVEATAACLPASMPSSCLKKIDPRCLKPYSLDATEPFLGLAPTQSTLPRVRQWAPDSAQAAQFP